MGTFCVVAWMGHVQAEALPLVFKYQLASGPPLPCPLRRPARPLKHRARRRPWQFVAVPPVGTFLLVRIWGTG